MTRDRITVEREYEGDICGRDCPLLDTGEDSCSRIWAWCNGFGVQKLHIRTKDDKPFRCPACLSTHGLPEPTSPAVREAIKTVSGVLAEIQHDIDRINAMTVRPIEATYVHVSGVDALVAGFRTLLSYVRAVQLPRLTGERLEAVRAAHKTLKLCDHREAVQRLRRAFPELADE